MDVIEKPKKIYKPWKPNPSFTPLIPVAEWAKVKVENIVIKDTDTSKEVQIKKQIKKKSKDVVICYFNDEIKEPLKKKLINKINFVKKPLIYKSKPNSKVLVKNKNLPIDLNFILYESIPKVKIEKKSIWKHPDFFLGYSAPLMRTKWFLNSKLIYKLFTLYFKNSKYLLKSYQACGNRRYKLLAGRLKQLRRPVFIMFATRVCNIDLLLKNKLRFLKQWFRYFLKNSRGYILDPYFKLLDEWILSAGDSMYLTVRIKKSALKKLFLKLSLYIVGYYKLKRRSYCINFIFFFVDLSLDKNDISIDINCTCRDMLSIFITTNKAYWWEVSRVLLLYDITIKWTHKKPIYIKDDLKKLYF